MFVCKRYGKCRYMSLEVEECKEVILKKLLVKQVSVATALRHSSVVSSRKSPQNDANPQPARDSSTEQAQPNIQRSFRSVGDNEHGTVTDRKVR